jgi:hypothetical protein
MQMYFLSFKNGILLWDFRNNCMQFYKENCLGLVSFVTQKYMFSIEYVTTLEDSKKIF